MDFEHDPHILSIFERMQNTHNGCRTDVPHEYSRQTASASAGNFSISQFYCRRCEIAHEKHKNKIEIDVNNVKNLSRRRCRRRRRQLQTNYIYIYEQLQIT